MDHHCTPIHPVARKRHRCIACYFDIQISERYTQQSGFYDGAPYRNRFHNECFESMADDECGDFEFTPGDQPPPERLLEERLK
jgi:hypothetical protein